MKVIQALISDGGSTLVAWLENRKGIAVGCTVTLKAQPGRSWVIEQLYSTIEQEDLHTDWCVGGITVDRGHDFSLRDQIGTILHEKKHNHR